MMFTPSFQMNIFDPPRPSSYALDCAIATSHGGRRTKFSGCAPHETSRQEIAAENADVLLSGSVAVAVMNEAAAGGVSAKNVNGV